VRVPRKVSLLTASVAIASILAGCSSSTATTAPTAAPATQAATADGSAAVTAAPAATADFSNPIVVGGIATLTGGIPFVDLPPGVQAYFDMINEQGGIGGRALVYKFLDDGGSPAESLADAKKLTLENNIVGYAGNVSLTDCITNMKYYEESNTQVVGLGPQPECYTSPWWISINPGPYVSTKIELAYAFETLKATKVCMIGQNEPGSIDTYKKIVTDYTAKTGNKLTLEQYTNDTTQSPTPEMVQAKNAGCEVLITHTMPNNWVAIIQAAKAVGLDATMINHGSAYDASVPSTLGDLAEPGALGSVSKGLFVPSELAPFSLSSFKGLEDYQAWMKKKNLPVSFWTEGGWLSGEAFVTVLKTIKGEITRDSVTQAWKDFAGYQSAFSGSVIKRGANNQSAYMMTIKGGTWVSAPPDAWSLASF
jgi:branched-chain amino acid transport system substrate-binding protein